jgi:hypothetical protein
LLWTTETSTSELFASVCSLSSYHCRTWGHWTKQFVTGLTVGREGDNFEIYKLMCHVLGATNLVKLPLFRCYSGGRWLLSNVRSCRISGETLFCHSLHPILDPTHIVQFV